ncbi:FCD domain-containing protein, partial [Streptomyces sp. NPDC059374]|uniref:FCD domain-containing protein n=1 Tax=Streptomyces sp. NPDC059374 TaxID=3346814 RepID=UPI00369698B3
FFTHLPSFSFSWFAPNTPPPTIIAVFRDRIRKYQVFTLPEGPELRRKSDDDHRVLATALAAHDPVAAAGAAQAHVAQTERWLRAFMPPVEEVERVEAPGSAD